MLWSNQDFQIVAHIDWNLVLKVIIQEKEVQQLDFSLVSPISVSFPSLLPIVTTILDRGYIDNSSFHCHYLLQGISQYGLIFIQNLMKLVVRA